jgi:hypothetical protein
VADDEPLGHALDLGRVAGQRLYLVCHQRSSDHGRALIPNLFSPSSMLALPSTANALPVQTPPFRRSDARYRRFRLKYS